MTSNTLVAAFDRLLVDHPERPIVLSSTGATSAARLSIVADALTDAGFADRPPPGVVGLAAANGIWFLAAFVALRRMGHTVLLLDPQTPLHALRETVSRFGGRRLVLQDSTCELRCVECPEPQIDPWLGGVIKLSSGSTGDPRGIATPTAALMADDIALTRTMGIRAQDRLVAMVPFSHSYGLSSLVVPALTRGWQLVIPDGGNPFSALQAAQQFEATVLPTAPAFLRGMVRAGNRIQLAGSLRLIISAGAPLSPDTAKQFESLFDLPVHVFYGASESGGITYDRTGTAGKRGTVGTPVDGVSLQLESSGTGQNGGQVVVQSEAVAAQYLPMASTDLGEGTFRSNDVAEWAGGEVKLHGRQDQLINVRGKKVHPREVQEVISRLTGVEEALVTGTPQNDSVVAIVALDASLEVSDADVVAWCRERLAPFKVPRRVLVVGEIPRTARGKIDHHILQRLITTQVTSKQQSS